MKFNSKFHKFLLSCKVKNAHKDLNVDLCLLSFQARAATSDSNIAVFFLQYMIDLLQIKVYIIANQSIYYYVQSIM